MSISSHLVQNLGSIILFSGSRALDQLNNLGIRDLAKVVIVHTDGHEGIGGFEADDVIGGLEEPQPFRVERRERQELKILASYAEAR